MHIWAFIPPQDDLKEPIWQVLYDTGEFLFPAIDYFLNNFDFHFMDSCLQQPMEIRLTIYIFDMILMGCYKG